MENYKRERQYDRIGPTAKCPACGVSMDPEAYRCPKCRIYFCFKCRVRITRGAAQFQCADQSCQYYGKLRCAACTVMVKQTLPQTFRTETSTKEENGHIKKVLVGSVLIGGATMFLAPAAVAVGAAAASAIGGAILLNRLGIRLLSTKEEKSYQVPNPLEFTEHRCCVACRHSVRQV